MDKGLVKVRWLDAASYNEGWHDTNKLPTTIEFFNTYGILFKEDDLCIYLTDTIRKDGFVGVIHQIPKGMVEEITYIKKEKWLDAQ